MAEVDPGPPREALPEVEVRRRRRYVLTLAPGQVLLETRRNLLHLGWGALALWGALLLAPCGLPLVIKGLSAPLPVGDQLAQSVARWSLDAVPCAALFAAALGLLGLLGLHAAFQRKELTLEHVGPLRVRMQRLGAEAQEWEVARDEVQRVRVEAGALSCADQRWLLPLSDADALACEEALRRLAGGAPRDRDARGKAPTSWGCAGWAWTAWAGCGVLMASQGGEALLFLWILALIPLGITLVTLDLGGRRD